MPFIMSPNLWGKLNSRSSRSDVVERKIHEDGIKIATNSPEAFEEVYWGMTYDDSLAIQKNNFKSLVQLVLFKNKKKRYLSKNNQNLKRLHLINDIYPESNILFHFANHCNILFLFLISILGFVYCKRRIVLF